MTKKCRHKFRLRWHDFKIAHFICDKCKQEAERDLSKDERRQVLKDFKRKPEVHKIYHEFQRKFEKEIAKESYSGHKFSEKFKKWAQNYPEIQIAHCDDEFFTNSTIGLIPHQDRYEYFGTTVIYIAQCTGEKPVRFFLYPCDLKSLETALANIKKMQRQKREKRKSITIPFKIKEICGNVFSPD